ncbi:MAG: pimeloyl-ACP methyl ester carboxylesterase [Planctomycetota bacterium]|jgi:pimeloyl-ACP methyl ester carboxylesterase
MSNPPIERAQELTRPFKQLYDFEPHFTETPAGWQHYVDEGDQHSDPILCVHGNPTWSFIWRRVATEFRADARVVAPDHMGCGLSDRPQDWSYRLEDHVDNLERLVLKLDLKRITLVVHDWGGAIGMGVAVRHPARFERFVVSNTAAFPSSLIPKRIAVCRIPLLGSLMLRGLGAFERAATVMATKTGLDPAVKQGLLAPYTNWHDRIAVQRFVQDIPMRESHPTWSILNQIADKLTLLADKPMLLPWGERDFCFSPAFRKEWEERFPQAESIPFEKAGHYLFEDETERYLEELRAFIGRYPLPPSDAQKQAQLA